MTSALATLPDIERLSPRVIRILGGNPGKFTLQGTNTYLVGTGRQRLLIDTAEGKPAWKAPLNKLLKEENAAISKTIITHWHRDHVGGIDDIRQLAPGTLVYKNQPGVGEEELVDGQVLSTEGATLRAFHCPGHTEDHMAFILDEEDAMFTGDNVLGQGTAVFEDLKTYMDSLERMSGAFGARAYPGHGPVIEDGPGRVKEYIRHRWEREEQILRVLLGPGGSRRGSSADGGEEEERQEDGPGQAWYSSMAIVKVVYKDYPHHLHAPAERSVLHVLRKLEKEGRVLFRDGDWRLVDGK